MIDLIYWMSYSISMAQTITVSCKLQVPTEIQPDVDKTLVKFADACNRILDTALMETMSAIRS